MVAPKFTGALAGAIAFLILAPFAPAAADDAGEGGLRAAGAQLLPARPATLPTVLSQADRDRYARIFELQAAGKWGPAKKLIRGLEDRILMGHVLFQRYMHPTKYRSKFSELAAWMKLYADHPGAWRVYRLANRRRAKTTRAPRSPVAVTFRVTEAEDTSQVSPNSRSRAQNRRVRRAKIRITSRVRRGWPTGALAVLNEPASRKLFSAVEIDSALARIAAGYYTAGKDAEAYRHASAAAERSRARVSKADWTAGLAAWRLGRHGDAARHFEALAGSKTANEATVTAGALWAARAYLADRQPRRVGNMLAAASRSNTFYGLIASRLGGSEIEFDWSPPPLGAGQIADLQTRQGVRRALALVEAGNDHGAEQELRLVFGRSGPETDAALLGLATRLVLPATQLRLADFALRAEGRPFASARYPLPDWQPESGFSVDRALVYAFVRQESRFNARAKSRAGARGLMQIMPRTAAFLTRDRSLRWSRRDKLFDPEFNIALGQRYLRHLIAYDELPDDLVTLAASYNGGPGNTKKWRRTIDFGGDPLLFIESLPLRETSNFVKLVLANLWIYRARLGQPAPSLDALAAGEWPAYNALEADPVASLPANTSSGDAF